MTAGDKWTWEETLMAWALYMVLPAAELDDKKPDVQALAGAIGRGPNAVALKIWNIAAHDKRRCELGKVGMRHGSKLDQRVWEAFEERGDALIEQAVDLLGAHIARSDQSEHLAYATMELFPEGATREAVVATRVNQRYFRNTLLKNYGNACCVTGLRDSRLLVASHIKPWKASGPKEKLAPDNGLLLNALHDRAFDQGLITLDKQLRIVVSPCVPKDGASQRLLWRYDGAEIVRPALHAPRREFIEYHNDVIFQR